MSRTTQNVYGAGPARIGGPARNLPSGPVRYGVPANSIGARELAPNAVQAGDIATSALGRCRYAAFSGLGAASTAGAFATVTWAPTAGRVMRFRGVAASAVVPGGQVYLMGRPASGYAAIAIETNGTLSITNGTTPVASSAAGAISFNGLPFEWQADITDTSAVLRVNGATVASTTFAAVGWNTVTGTNGIGAFGTGTHRRWPGSIQDIEFLDLASPPNSIRLLMDEPSGNYANTYPGSTAAASATRNGYVSTVPVLSLDGRGMPWQGGSMSCLLFSRASSISAGSVLPPSGSTLNLGNGIILPFPARITAVSVIVADNTAATMTIAVNRDGSSVATTALTNVASAFSYADVVVAAGQRISVTCSAFTSGAGSGATIAVWIMNNPTTG